MHGFDSYSVMLDPTASHFSRREEYMQRSLEEAKSRDMLFAVVTSEEPDDWLMLQVGAMLAHGGEVVVAYHKVAYRSSIALNLLASKLISWNTISGLTKAIESQVCDNRANDSNVIGISGRKTA
jgi:hypothetical protein